MREKKEKKRTDNGGGVGRGSETVRLRFRSLIRRYRIEYFTESVLAPSRTMDPEPTFLKRTDWAKEPSEP